MEFPDDFVWPNQQVLSDARTAISKGENTDKTFDSLALMDGGIYDNQGIDSLLLADKRDNKSTDLLTIETKDIDLLIISDVDPTRSNLFPYPQDEKPLPKITLGQLDSIIRLFLFVCVLTIISVIYSIWQDIQQGTFIWWQNFFSALIPLTLVAGVTLSIWWGRQTIKKLLDRIPQVGSVGWQDLKTLTVDEFFYLLELRTKSLLALTSSVFMDRIKALIFAQVYENKNYKRKLISNRIDRLINPKRKIDVPNIVPLSQKLKGVIQSASDMPTTLWFGGSPQLENVASPQLEENVDSPQLKNVDSQKLVALQQLRNVTVAGQATICFNLMQYIVRQYGKDSGTYPPAIQEMWDSLNQDWKKLNDDPNSLLQELLPEEKLPEL